MSKLLNGKLSYILIVTCYLVAFADFITTWMALSYNQAAEETGILASRVMKLGGFPVLLVFDIFLIGIFTSLAYVIYVRYRSNLAVALLLGPYICAGIVASINNWRAVP